jgi:hypothetical protein
MNRELVLVLVNIFLQLLNKYEFCKGIKKYYLNEI